MTYDELINKFKSGELSFDNNYSEGEKTVNPNDIVLSRDPNQEGFWTDKGHTKEGWQEFVESGEADKLDAPEVSKCGDQYILTRDGNHRIAMSQELNRPVNVDVQGQYIEQNQEQEQEEDEGMEM